MGKLEVGMWVRTNNGNIRKITELVNSECIDEPDYYVDKVLIDIVQDDKTENTIYMEKWLFDENIIKSSFNIIDLIEVGDILRINEFKDVYEICEVQEFKERYFPATYLGVYISNKGIRKLNEIPLINLSIVTKEQFESMEYKVGDRNE